MSIYLVHVLLAFLAPAFVGAVLTPKGESFKNIYKAIIFAIIGFLIFKACKHALIDQKVIFFVNLALILVLVLCFVALFFKSKVFRLVCICLLFIAQGFIYGEIGSNFPVFQGELLDSLSLTSLFLIAFGLILVVCFYFIVYLCQNQKLKFSLFLLSIVLLIVDRAGFLVLFLMQNGVVKTYTSLLSIVAKVIYFNGFLPYIFSFFAFIIVLFEFLSRPKSAIKSEVGSIKFRQIKAARSKANGLLVWVILVFALNSSFMLYFYLIASAPPKISTPTLVQPVNGEFKFDVSVLKDNKLHRYAYVTDTGHEVRFFLLNRYADKSSPIIVFDACSICGDMGYVKKGNDLICISCNVRIFLPSVGKAGGCNPIPMEYSYDGKTISVKQKTIEDGAVFFTKIVEKMVTDPVSLEKVSNIKTKFTYLYYGKTYFFKTQENMDKFSTNPELYVTTDGRLKERK
ncbi:Fe-S-containing protein [Campylobacter geochelonis]|uniref:Fe-S-containing protein n=1 Tax=Campylobacter geochelonis TaxID=1780362 RepID=UPI000770A1C5|nr:Fe-S-containing protein [Campylobacter geochelonis]CZE49983.1 integral membrane protein [Campylobacter geochelonis]